MYSTYKLDQQVIHPIRVGKITCFCFNYNYNYNLKFSITIIQVQVIVIQLQFQLQLLYNAKILKTLQPIYSHTKP